MSIEIDADPVPTSDILEVYPDADIDWFSPVQIPQVYVFFFEGNGELIADGAVHSLTSVGIIPPTAFLDEEGPEGFSWAPFVEPPYRLRGSLNLMMSFIVDGTPWFAASGGECGPDHGPQQ